MEIFKRRPYEINANVAQTQTNTQLTVIRDSRNNEIYINPHHDAIVIDDGNVIYSQNFDSPTITRERDKLRIKCKFGPPHTCDIGTTVVIYDLTKIAICAGSNNIISV